SSPGIAVTESEILGYWKRSAAVGEAVSKSALITRKLSLNKPGPGRVNSLEGAPSNYQSAQPVVALCALKKAHSPLVALCALKEVA
ncbi:MAG TPA: hypothetical protein VIY49_13900, partial [Bryobacteraceae bacterium]